MRSVKILRLCGMISVWRATKFVMSLYFQWNINHLKAWGLLAVAQSFLSFQLSQCGDLRYQDSSPSCFDRLIAASGPMKVRAYASYTSSFVRCRRQW